MTFTIHHIHSHQDQDTPLHLLSNAAQANCRADQLAAQSRVTPLHIFSLRLVVPSILVLTHIPVASPLQFAAVHMSYVYVNTSLHLAHGPLPIQLIGLSLPSTVCSIPRDYVSILSGYIGLFPLDMSSIVATNKKVPSVQHVVNMNPIHILCHALTPAAFLLKCNLYLLSVNSSSPSSRILFCVTYFLKESIPLLLACVSPHLDFHLPTLD